MLKTEDYKDQEGKDSPYRNANIFMKVYFCWLLPFLRYGYRHNLEQGDIYNVLNHDSIQKQSARLQREWDAELEKQNRTGEPPSLGWALFRLYRLPMLAFGFLATIEECVFKVAQPVLLAILVQYFGSNPSITRQQAYLCATGIGFCSFMLMTLHHVCWFVFCRTGMHMRVSTTALVYKKALTLSNTAFQKTTIGQIINLLSNDVNRFDRVTLFIHYLWVAPIQIVTMLAILWYQMGALSLVAISTLMVLIPIQAFMAKMFSKLRAQTAVLTDERVRIMNEIISANKVIKVHGWEESFTEQVKEARRKEVQVIRKTALLMSVMKTLFRLGSTIIVGATFIAIALLGNTLDLSTVFLVLPLVKALSHNFTGKIVGITRNLSEFYVTLGRVKQFLLLEELESLPKGSKLDEAHGNQYGSRAYVVLDEDPDGGGDREKQENMRLMEIPPNSTEPTEGQHNSGSGESRPSHVPDKGGGSEEKREKESQTDFPEGHQTSEDESGEHDKLLNSGDPVPMPNDGSVKIANDQGGRLEAVRVEGLFGSWKSNTSITNVLEDVSFTVRKGEILAVIGPVGSGKSSLLMALLGELPDRRGQCVIDGKVAYASQQPWLFSGPFQQNIVFAKEFQKKRYWEAVSVCALNRDIANLPEGDLTLVGERGVQLSGGQKARVGLARAVYSDADVYLLDDPLSAVDTAVGRHLFERCIKGALKDKAVILVTHQLQYLNEVDKIIILKEGKITGHGTYQELVDAGVDFAAIISESDDQDHREDHPSQGGEDEQPVRRRGGGGGGGGGRGQTGEDVDPKGVKAGKMNKERKEVGTVGFKVYRKYLLAGTSLLPLVFFVVVNLSAQGFLFLSDWWLTNWAYIEEQCVDVYSESVCLTNTTALQEFADIPRLGRSYFILVYLAFLMGLVLFGFLRTLWLFFICIRSSENLHNRMFAAVVRAPMRFFDTNSAGRILNRFAKDVGFMDESLPPAMAEFNSVCVQTLLSVIVVCVFNPLVIVLLIPLAIVLVYTRSYYLASSRDVKRIEAVARSPVFTHLSASLQGLATIRAFRAEQRFVTDFYYHQDNHTRGWMMFLCIARWFSIMLDAIVTIFVIFTALASVVSADLFDLNPVEVGLSLTYAIGLLTIFQWGVRQSTEIENLMTSTERVIEYSELKPEGPLETEHKPAPDWPRYGNITFEGVSLKYSDDGPTVLKNLRCSFRSKEKIGIVGRTGAGKTSLTVSLFRLAEPSGMLKIDGEDITELGLHDLRQNLSYIPQDPVLFRGTLRHNLDPFSEYTDDDIWRSLKEVQLDSVIDAYPEKLEVPVSEEGKNFSVGQRQLLCLARAMLRKNRILVIDEATANVDLETDRLIQVTVREKFKDCTVLTVAHRLNTVIDSDRVLVMEEGKIVEFDEPFILLQKNDGFFSKMINDTGTQEAAHLWEVAKGQYKERYSDDPYRLLQQDE